MASSYFRDDSPELREVIQRTLSLGEAQLRAINGWARPRMRELLETEDLPEDIESVARDLQIDRVGLAAALSFLATAVVGGDRPGNPQIDVLVAELEAQGLPEVRTKVPALLDRISVDEKRTLFIRQRAILGRAVVPTLEGADTVCELRGVFRRMPSPNPSKGHKESVRDFLGFESVALVALHINDASGNDSTPVFQASSRELKHLIKTLEETLAQMEELQSKSQAAKP